MHSKRVKFSHTFMDFVCSVGLIMHQPEDQHIVTVSRINTHSKHFFPPRSVTCTRCVISTSAPSAYGIEHDDFADKNPFHPHPH